MLKKCIFIVCLFSCCVLYAFSAIPYKNIEVTRGKGSKCSVSKTSLALFYDSASITKESDFNYLSIVEKTQAKLMFIEEVDGVVSYYYYSKKLPKHQVVNGVKVNLHVAVSNDQVKIGTPFIYGGY